MQHTPLVITGWNRLTWTNITLKDFADKGFLRPRSTIYLNILVDASRATLPVKFQIK